MSALLDSLASGFEGPPSGRAALDAVLRDGLPGPRSEAWKYTSLRALERRAFAASTGVEPADRARIEAIPAPRLVFVNGIHHDGLSDLAGLDAGVSFVAHAVPADIARDPSPDVFARLNAALARVGATVSVAAGVHATRPLHLAFVGAAAGHDLAWHLRHRIDIGEGASATLVEHHFADGTHAHLGNTVAEVSLARDARLVHARIQDDAATATAFLQTDARLDAGAHYLRTDLELGNALSRHALDVRLEGDGARVTANGVLFADGRRHVDTRLGIEHAARDTACALVWRGLGTGRGRAVFHGGITIHAGADGSDADLSNKNLLLSDGAEIDTQPVLEIHADEVQASHGATVGQLDESALFYLRSRGVPEHEARTLLTLAFCRVVLDGIEDEALRERLDVLLRARLPEIAA